MVRRPAHRLALLTARRIAALLLSAAPALGAPSPAAPTAGGPRAIILFVGDGFGVSHLALARYALKRPGGRLALESLPEVGLVTTWSASNAVTDSGAAATAFSAGVKTDNQYIGLDPDAQPVELAGELAKRAGWRVGLVTTTRVTHATPACYYGHHRDRYDEETIAAQLVGADLDLVLGGGRAQFVPPEEGGVRTDGRDLLAEARGTGWTVLERGDPLAWSGEGRLLGVLANSHLAYQVDDRNYPPERRDPSLESLTRFALDALERRGEPFFLMVEGGRIDHSGHEFDVAGVVAETAAFDAAVAAALDYQLRRPDTLIVLTADHATGGLAINDFSRWEDLPRRTASTWWLANQIRNGGAGVELLAERTGYPDLFTAADVEAIRRAPDTYEACRRLGRRLAERDGFTWLPRVDEDDTKGHTGEDVMVLAGGPGAERFRGLLDNTDLPQRIAELAGWPFAGRQFEAGAAPSSSSRKAATTRGSN